MLPHPLDPVILNISLRSISSLLIVTILFYVMSYSHLIGHYYFAPIPMGCLDIGVEFHIQLNMVVQLFDISFSCIGGKMQKSRNLAIVFIMSTLILNACSLLPIPDLRLSDEEFAAEAVSVCDDLQVAYEGVNTLEQDLVVFREAAVSMMDYDLNPETAPQAMILRDSLAALSDASLVFSAALNEIAVGSGWGEYTWMIFGSKVMAYPKDKGILGIEEWDVDGAILQEYLNNFQAVKDSAGALGLDGCLLEENDS